MFGLRERLGLFDDFGFASHVSGHFYRNLVRPGCLAERFIGRGQERSVFIVLVRGFGRLCQIRSFGRPVSPLAFGDRACAVRLLPGRCAIRLWLCKVAVEDGINQGIRNVVLNCRSRVCDRFFNLQLGTLLVLGFCFGRYFQGFVSVLHRGRCRAYFQLCGIFSFRQGRWFLGNWMNGFWVFIRRNFFQLGTLTRLQWCFLSLVLYHRSFLLLLNCWPGAGGDRDEILDKIAEDKFRLILGGNLRGFRCFLAINRFRGKG